MTNKTEKISNEPIILDKCIKMRFDNVTCAYVYLANPLTYENKFSKEGGEIKKWSMQMCIDKTDTFNINNAKIVTLAAIERFHGKKIHDKLVQELETDPNAWLGEFSGLKLPFRNGDKMNSEDYPHLVGRYFANTTNMERPEILVQRMVKPEGSTEFVQQTCKATEEEIEEFAYSGARYYIMHNIYGFNKGTNKGIGISPRVVLLTGEGELLGYSSNPVENFSDIKLNNIAVSYDIDAEDDIM